MSNSNSPRTIKVKKLPRGGFSWKVCLFLQPGNKMTHYDRYYNEHDPLTPEIKEYLQNSVHGKYSVHQSAQHQYKNPIVKHDYIMFQNQLDVSLFKLCFGYAIRRIYKLEVVEKGS